MRGVPEVGESGGPRGGRRLFFCYGSRLGALFAARPFSITRNMHGALANAAIIIRNRMQIIFAQNICNSPWIEKKYAGNVRCAQLGYKYVHEECHIYMSSAALRGAYCRFGIAPQFASRVSFSWDEQALHP